MEICLPDEVTTLHHTLLSLADGQRILAGDLITQLEACLAELRKTLYQPPKSEESRKKLQEAGAQKIITLQGKTSRITDAFVTESVALSDKLKLDELEAAALILCAAEHAHRFDRSYVQSAICVFHSQREVGLECIRLLLACAVDSSAYKTVRQSLYDFIPKLYAGKESLPAVCLENAASIRDQLNDVEEATRRGVFLGQNAEEGFSDILQLRRKGLLREHEIYGMILSYAAVGGLLSVADFTKLQTAFEQAETVQNSTVLHLLLPVLVYLRVIIGDEELKGADIIRDAKLTGRDLRTVHESVMNKRQANEAQSSSSLLLFAQIHWTAHLTGRCKYDAETATSFDYARDVLTPTKTAIKNAAFDLVALRVLPFVNNSGLRSYLEVQLIGLMRQQVVGAVANVREEDLVSSEDMSRLLRRELEIFIDAFVGNIADVLKDIKLAEEDLILAHSQQQDEPLSPTTPLEPINHDLESFFYVIAKLYDGRKKAAEKFWVDHDSNLYGFLVWGLKCQTPSMICAFAHLLSCIATGEEASAALFAFLSEDGDLKGPTSRVRFSFTWKHIFDALQHYAQQLAPRPKMSSSRGFIAMTDEGEHLAIDSESQTVLLAYLQLVERVTQYSMTARVSMYENLDLKAFDVLFTFLECRPSGELQAALLRAVSGFCFGGVRAIKDVIWQALEHWVFLADLPAASAWAGRSTSRPKSRVEQILTFPNEVMAFIDLLTKLVEPNPEVDVLNDSLPFPEGLGRSHRTSDINPYVDYVINVILMNVSSCALSLNEQIRLYEVCINFIETCLDSYNLNLVSIADMRVIDVSNAMRASTLTTYVASHPGARVLYDILNERTSSLILDLASLGVEAIAGKPRASSLVKLVNASLKVVTLALDVETPFIDAVLPQMQTQSVGLQKQDGQIKTFESSILYRVPFLVHAALYVGADRDEIARSALAILSKVEELPMFSTVPGHGVKSRLLSALDTVDESRRIVFGFLNKLEAPLPKGDGQASVVAIGEREDLRTSILKFIRGSLRKEETSASVGHMVLGFEVAEGTGLLKLSTDRGGIASGVSVFHLLLDFIRKGCELEEQNPSSLHYMHLSDLSMEIVSYLCGSSSTSDCVLNYLRTHEDFFTERLDREFRMTMEVYTAAAEANGNDSVDLFSMYGSLLRRRQYLLQYLAAELYTATQQGSLSQLHRYLRALIGLKDVSETPHGQDYHFIPNRSYVRNGLRLLDFLEFLDHEVDIPDTPTPLTALDRYGSVSLDACQKVSDDGLLLFDYHAAYSIVSLKITDLINADPTLATQLPNMQTQRDSDIRALIEENHARGIRAAQVHCVMNWVKIVKVLMQDCLTAMDDHARERTSLELIQEIVPRLSHYVSTNETILEAFSEALLTVVAVAEDRFLNDGEASVLGDERLQSAFRIVTQCIASPSATQQARETLYTIAVKYIKYLMTLQEESKLAEGNARIIKAAGERFVEVVCQDAVQNGGPCRVMAFLLLEALAAADARYRLDQVLDVLVRRNYLQAFILSIKDSEKELSTLLKPGFGLTYELTEYRSKMSLLLRLAMTKAGAIHISQTNFARLLQSSFLNTELDIQELPVDARQKYRQLFEPMLSVLLCCLFSIGTQHMGLIQHAREFAATHKSAIRFFLKHESKGQDSSEFVRSLLALELVANSA
ncbi:hypothetical protein YB2330_005431 [Saitoella coloradoensis]